jgi:uncharacterized protein (TIGR02611 family)
MDFLTRHGKRILLESLGWLLVVVGIAAIILPGPGLLILFCGMALLATQYEWAERRLEPVRKAAFKGAKQSVESRTNIVVTICFAFVLFAVGLVWGLHPAVPGWWPLKDSWWLIGGWGTGATLIFSGCIMLGILAYSLKTFRN